MSNNELKKHTEDALEQVPEEHRRRGLTTGAGAALGGVGGSVLGGPIGAAVGAPVSVCPLVYALAVSGGPIGAAVGAPVGGAVGVAVGEKSRSGGGR